MNDQEYQRRVAELESYRQRIETLRDEVRASGPGLNRLSLAVAFALGIAAGAALNYFTTDRVTHVIFCDQEGD